MSQSTERWGWVSLGQMLLSDGILTQEQLAQALARQRKTRDRLGQILIEMKLLDEEVLLRYLGRQFRKEAITQQELESLDLDVVKLVPQEVARQHRIVAAERRGRKLIVATTDPLNVVVLDDLRRVTGLEVDFKIGSGQAIQEAIDRSYRQLVSPEAVDDALRQDLGLSPVAGAAVDEAVDLQELRTQADDQPVVKVVNYVWSRARCTWPSCRGSRSSPASTSPSAGCRRTAASPPTSGGGRSTSGSRRCRPFTARRWSCGCWRRRRWSSTTRSRTSGSTRTSWSCSCGAFAGPGAWCC